MAVDIEGQSADMNSINSIAKKYNLKVICDTAQAPGAMFEDSYTGTCRYWWIQFKLSAYSYGRRRCLITNDDNLAKNSGY